ncbi:anti-sigma regulatory factor [Massilibacterium senegalense]|uniref:anti-sigma regulatory factor n=1 Tax=Massilibacterium senegalense TaxID=1632858 RepID=UPI0007850C0A|nr:anti-sigma regulatory factor [Massilibacterium senegalense]
MSQQSYVVVKNEWDIVAARQLGRDTAKKLGFGSVDQARITTAISELARNIYLYAYEGEIHIEVVSKESKMGVKITSKDKGPGIQDIRSVMQNGFSSSGGLGAGLPGVKRLMDEFEIDSNEQFGTLITAVKWLR